MLPSSPHSAGHMCHTMHALRMQVNGQFQFCYLVLAVAPSMQRWADDPRLLRPHTAKVSRVLALLACISLAQCDPEYGFVRSCKSGKYGGGEGRKELQEVATAEIKELCAGEEVGFARHEADALRDSAATLKRATNSFGGCVTYCGSGCRRVRRDSDHDDRAA